MTSSSAFIPLSNNSHTSSPLPSPPLSHQYNHITYFDKKMPTLTVDRALSTYTSYNSAVGGGDRSGLHSDTRYTSNNNNNRRRDVAELRPFLFKPVSDNNNNKYQLPPIQNVMMTTPTASPSPLFDSYYSMQSSSPISSIASSPTPIDEDDDDEDQQQKHQQLINIRRKGSIASLLNSDPELRQLDEEESKCNYQSHFIDNYSSSYQTSLKRGRPRQDHIETVYNQYQHPIIKKQRTLNSNVRDNSISHDLDCVQQQACQSSSLVTSNTTNLLPNSIANESPRAAKGLRHFSKQVCDKVAEKGVTTYNEVADELALDIQNSVGNEKHSYDQKNIRRRVYDALNVLMAMNIIAKDKKVIKWLGIPECYKQKMNGNSKKVVVIEQEDPTQMLLKQIEQEEQRQSELMSSLNNLRQTISQNLSKHLQIRNLVQRNQQYNSKQNNQDNNRSSRISLPFFIVACPIANDNNKQIDMVNYSHSAVITFRHTTEHVVYQDSDILQHLNFD